MNPDFSLEYFKKLSERYLRALLDGEKKNASNLILEASSNGADMASIYADVFQPAQYQVGELWQAGKISVAQEHFCTSVTCYSMSLLYDKIFSTKKIGKTFLSMCVSQELHDMGIRMVTDMIELSGFDTVYLGANMPDKDIQAAIMDYKADVIGLSATFASNLAALAKTIKAIKDDLTMSSVKILVGGYCMISIKDIAKKLGADAFAKDCNDAVKIIHSLVAEC